MTFILFSEGIPIIYYGSEQAYNMGGDPESRQAMFGDFDEDADIYKYLENVINIRKTNAVSFRMEIECLFIDRYGV
jgi:alpha-amylase